MTSKRSMDYRTATKLRLSFVSLLTIACTLTGARAAQASWEVIYTTTGTTQEINGRTQETPYKSTWTNRENWDNVAQGSTIEFEFFGGDPAFIYLAESMCFADNTKGAFESNRTTVSAKLHWVPNGPDDLPPTKVYVVDQFYTSTQCDFYCAPNATFNPRDYVTFSLKTPGVEEPEVTVQEPAPYFGGDWKGQVFGLAEKNDLRVINNYARRDTIDLPSFLLRHATTLSPSNNAWSNASAFAYSVRRIWIPSFAVEVRRHESEATPSSSTTIAAGGHAPDEHISDVFYKVSQEYPWLSEIKWPPMRPKIIRGNGISGGNAKFVDAPKDIDPAGRVLLGELYSSNKITHLSNTQEKRVTLKLPVGQGVNDPKAYVLQKWDDADEWTMLPYLLGNENNTFVRFKPKFDGVPITGHTLTMQVPKIKVRFWNSVSNKNRIKIITTDPTEVDLEANPQVVLGDPTVYASFDGDAVDEGEGVYKGKLTLHPPETVTIEQLWFKARDEGTYHPAKNE